MPIVGEVTNRELTEEEKEQWRRNQADSEWLREHWDEILEKYAGQGIAIANQELFVGKDPKDAYERARQKYPDYIPLVQYIPSYRGKWIR